MTVKKDGSGGKRVSQRGGGRASDGGKCDQGAFCARLQMSRDDPFVQVVYANKGNAKRLAGLGFPGKKCCRCPLPRGQAGWEVLGWPLAASLWNPPAESLSVPLRFSASLVLPLPLFLFCSPLTSSSSCAESAEAFISWHHG
jgi:hypothetical protein